MTRTDIHRPSVIEPSEYAFVVCMYQPTCGDPMADALIAQAARQHFDRFVASTGAKWGGVHGQGQCSVCGTRCRYFCVWHHRETNTMIHVGLDCTEKLWDCGDDNQFRKITSQIQALKDEVSVVRRNKAGRLKAAAVLDHAGQSAAWDLYVANDTTSPESCTICDIVGNLVRWGSLSEAQHELIGKMLSNIQNADQIAADKHAAWLAADPVPSGRHQISGRIVTVKTQESMYGTQLKCLLHDDRGFKVWMSLPTAAYITMRDAQVMEWKCTDTGERARLLKPVRLTCKANLEASRNDAKFGFGKSPTGAVVEIQERPDAVPAA